MTAAGKEKSEPRAEQLRRLLRAHPPRRRSVGGACWEYISCGRGEETLLLLPGALGRGETAFSYILAFAPAYRIIAPAYPAKIDTMDALTEGLDALLDAEKVPRAHVVGGSYSGAVAQCLACRFPRRVGRLILSDTGPPDPARAGRHALCLRAARLLPFSLVRALFRRAIDLFVRDTGCDRTFWRGHFYERIDAMTPAEITSLLRIWRDFDCRYAFAPDDLRERRESVLLLEAGDDWMVGARERRALRALYPHARTHTVSSGSHSASLHRAEEYIAVIARFLRGERRLRNEL